MGKPAQTLGEMLFDLDARIEGIFPLSIGDLEGLPEWFEDFCEDADGTAENSFREIASLAGLVCDDGFHDQEMVADRLIQARENGFVCKIAWCPRRYQTETMFVSGWGVTMWRWVYGKTFEEALGTALAVVALHHDQRAAEAKSKATAA